MIAFNGTVILRQSFDDPENGKPCANALPSFIDIMVLSPFTIVAPVYVCQRFACVDFPIEQGPVNKIALFLYSIYEE